MTDANFRSHSPSGQRDDGASARLPSSITMTPSVLRHKIAARRLFVTAVVAVVAALAAAVLFVALVGAGALPWIVGAVLALAVAGVIVLGIHAGGHGWFTPIPVVVLAAAWVGTVLAGTWWSAAAWLLAALALIGAVLAAVIVLPAIAYRRTAFVIQGTAALPGSSGVAVTALAPTGMARVNNETWGAKSVSGPLPAGASVHVIRAEGLRLLVWSEAGSIPGPDALGSTN
jgi:membrane-bound ClpP family serine protease